jgi:hypothetical protein
VEAQTSVPTKSSGFGTGSLSGERASLRARRVEGGLGRRGRKVYNITERGRQEFVALLADPSTLAGGETFSVRMALARFLTPSLRVVLLERRRADLVARLGELRANASHADLDPFARSVMEHAAKGVELDLAWIDQWLNTERTTETVAREAQK